MITLKDISKRGKVGSMELNSKIKGRVIGTSSLNYITDTTLLQQKTYVQCNEYLLD